MRDHIITASILNADFARLGEEVTAVLAAGADMIHFDVMDNHYVPNLTIGPMACAALRRYGIKAPIDVHLMTKPVDSLIVDFAKAGANYITIHPEATRHLDRSLQLIIDNGCKAGIAFNPTTPLSYLDYVWDKLDIVLLMSVNPGFGGQKFLTSTLQKTKLAKELIIKNKSAIKLAIDGGVNIDNIKEIAAAGANMFIVGSAIFQSNDNYAATITKLRNAI